MIEIYALKLDDKEQLKFNYFDQFLNLLPTNLQHKYFQDLSKGNRPHSLIAAIILQKVAKEKLKNASPLELSYGKHGKPSFIDYPHFHFNVSHAKDYVCVGFSESPIGIDIERNRNCQNAIVSRFLHEQEISDILSIENLTYRNIYFTQIWSLKESYVKYNGQGIANQFKDFFVQIEESGSISTSSNLENVYFSLLPTIENYQLSICSNIKQDNIPVFWINL